MFQINNIILHETEQGKRYERLLYTHGDIAYLIDIYGSSMPFQASMQYIQSELEKGNGIILENEPFIVVQNEADILPNHKLIRDNAYNSIKDIVTIEPDIYIPNKRTSIVKEYTDNIHVATIMRYLKRFWQRGMYKNALLPDYYNCGKKQRNTVDKEAFQISSETIKVFNTALNRFYYNSSQKTLTLTYELMIKEYFCNQGIVNENIPSLKQFRYWFNKERNLKKEVSSRQSPKKYELQHRGLTGTSNEAYGPGAIFQIDATVGDVYLVSQYNRNWIIGRPVIYTVMDIFSRCIVGLNVSLEGPSWVGASLALINAATDKVSFCRKYDIDIDSDEWEYCTTLPEAIIADRGELEGKNIESLINTFGIKVLNTSPYRGDMKGIIERYFKTLNEHTKPFIPGVIKSQFRERGEQDYRLSAALDLKQFTQVLIKCILYHNNHHYLLNYSRTEDMVVDDVKPNPKLIWKWGIINRSGLIRKVNEDILKLNLLPNDKATVTMHGIKYNGMLYGSKNSLRERWFEKSRNSGSWKVNICFDPRDMSYIYIKQDNGRSFEKCFLLEHQSRYKGKSMEEINYLLEYEKTQAKASVKIELQNKVNLLEDIEEIIDNAKKDTKIEAEQGISKKRRIENIRGNRSFEKQQERKENIIEIKEEPEIILQEKEYGNQEQEMFDILLKAQEEGKLNGQFDV